MKRCILTKDWKKKHFNKPPISNPRVKARVMTKLTTPNNPNPRLPNILSGMRTMKMMKMNIPVVM
jgi:hypothetical protein